MKSFRIIFNVLILLSIPFCSVFAQKPTFSYVLTVKGDTIKCDFKKPFMGKLRYLPLGSDKAIKITIDSIKEYYNAKDTVMVAAAILPNRTTPEFLNVLEWGKINMYQRVVITSGYVNSITYYWFVNKGTGLLKEIKATTMFTDGRKERKKMFSEMIADDEPLQGQFEADSDFSLKRLRYYIHEYNSHQIGETE